MNNCSPPSLKLLEMPLLCEKLGFKNALNNERITAVEEFGYSDRVLVGNWFDRRCDSPVSREQHLTTTYQEDYLPQTVLSTQNTRDVWDNRFQSQGSITLDDCDDNEGNMATIYDLAYRCRVRDFVTGDYGNVTGYGKKECKQRYWDTQRDTRRTRYHTEYSDSFTCPCPCPTHITS